MSDSQLLKTFMIVSYRHPRAYRRLHPTLRVVGKSLMTNLFDESASVLSNHISTQLESVQGSSAVRVGAIQRSASIHNLFSPLTCTLRGCKTDDNKYEYTYTIESYDCEPLKKTFVKDRPLRYDRLYMILYQEESNEKCNYLIKTDQLYPFTITETCGIIHIKDSKVDEFYEQRAMIASSIE